MAKEKKKQDSLEKALKDLPPKVAYKRWYDSLSPEEKAMAPLPEKLEDVSGMDGNWVFPVKEIISSHGANAFDWTRTPDGRLANYMHSDSEQEEEVSVELRMYTEDEVEEVVRRVVMAMQMSENPHVLFQARCILIAFGIGDPPTETELAKMKGCSRQFVSKKVKRIQQLFNLSPSQFMRSQQACKAYSKAYWKKRQEDGVGLEEGEEGIDG